MEQSILPFEKAVAAAKSIESLSDIELVLRDVSLRLREANSALAVDSASQILDTLLSDRVKLVDVLARSFEQIHAS